MSPFRTGAYRLARYKYLRNEIAAVSYEYARTVISALTSYCLGKVEACARHHYFEKNKQSIAGPLQRWLMCDHDKSRRSTAICRTVISSLLGAF